MSGHAVVMTAAVAAVLVVAGCSSSSESTAISDSTPTGPSLTVATSAPASSSAPAVAVPDACSLLTRAEADVLAGARLQKGVDQPAPTPKDIAACRYDAPVTGSPASVQLFAQIGTPHAIAVDRSLHHRFRSVAGIGDEVLEEPQNASIFVRKATVWVYVTVPFGATPKKLEDAARLIVSRLP